MSNRAANVGAVAVELASLANGNVTCNHQEDGSIVVGFAQDAGCHSFAVEVSVDVASRFGGERKIHVACGWSSDGGRSITQMQLGLAQAATFVESLVNWGFDLEVEVK